MTKNYFETKVDRRNRAAMVGFLAGHFRYGTMNSWNNGTSYANNVKVHRLGLTALQVTQAFELLDTDYWDEVREPIDDFTLAQGDSYTIGTNGRSGGYLVLYDSHREQTGHLSYCPFCGQRNFKKVPPTFENETEQVIASEILKNPNSWFPKTYLGQPAIRALPITDDEKLALVYSLRTKLSDCSATVECGVCRKPRKNFDILPSRLVRSPIGIDPGEDFVDWSLSQLRARVDLVCAFDAVCDQIRQNFIYLVDNCDVVAAIEMRPHKVKRIVERNVA